MYALPFPITLGASQIDGKREVSHPTRLYPTLRDLHEALHPERLTPRNNLMIVLEVDTKTGRTIGRMQRVVDGERPYVTIHVPNDSRRGYEVKNVGLDRILAFRVRQVEVEELPLELS